MPKLSRRALLATATAAASLPAFAAAATRSGPPVAPIRPVTETLFGVKITDRYRWMESEDAAWQTYIRAQGAYTAKILAKIPGRDALADAIAVDTGAIVAVVSLQTGGAKLFIEIRPAGANTSKLFVRDTPTGAGRKLVDPDTFAATGSHAALDWWAASPDGAHVAIGISTGGSEQSVLHIVNTATGALLPEIITRTRFGGVNWLPDSTGMFYTRQPDVPLDSDAAEENLICWFHKLGTDIASDTKIMGRGLSPAVSVQPIDDPYVAATPGSSLAIGTIISGVQNELAIYASPLAAAAAGHPSWTKICDPADAVTTLALRGDDIYLLTHKAASRYKILKTTASKPEISNAVEVVGESESVIRAIAAARDALYILDLNAGLAGLRRLAPDGAITSIKLPFAGSIDSESFYADTLHDGAWFLLQGWVHPTVVCYVSADGTVTQTDIAPKPPIDTSPYTSLETFATARDGVKIPVSIIYPRNFKRDGKSPVLLWAYGAYGISQDPAFLARWLPFLDLGGAFVVAHVRGGGERGEDWHLDGQKLKKYHTWQDDIDCAEYLIREHWTAKKHLAIIGGSAGGITVGRFMTERPDLAAVVIDEVGSSDTLRQEFSPNGPPNIPEFGSVATQEGFRALLAMDAYQHVHDGVKYPSILLTTGLNDPRVASWEPTKMTARLQAATASKNPVLLRVDLDAGHGMGSTRSQRDLETADTIAFVMWRTGDPRFQPK